MPARTELWLRQNANILQTMLYNWLGKKCQWRWERSIDRRILSITRLPANARKKKIQGWNPDINQEEYRDKHLIASFSTSCLLSSLTWRLNAVICPLEEKQLKEKQLKGNLFNIFEIKITFDIGILLIVINEYRITKYRFRSH